MFKNANQLIKQYFLGAALKDESDTLTKANYTIIYMVCISVVILLIPLEIIYLFVDEINLFQVLSGISAILFFLGILFFLKQKGSIVHASQVILIVSWLFFLNEMIFYGDMGLVKGLHLAVNLIYSVNMFDKSLLIKSIILHVVGLFIKLGNDKFGFLQVNDPIQTHELVTTLTTGIMMFIIIAILAFYNTAHLKMSKDLTESLGLLRIAKKSADEMNALKSRFLANMSHEIRTPLNGVLGITEILKESNTDAEIAEYLEIQTQSGYRLLNTIDGILSLSKLEVKSEFFQLSEVDLTVVADEVLRNQKTAAMARHIKLKRSYLSANTIVMVDENVIYQVISNVLNNAIKFTNNQGVVELRLENSDPHNIIMSVIDNGIGITPAFIPHIFEPFERDVANLSSSQTGTGLGLSITKKFVELMGGSIEVESELGKRTAFKIKLPTINKAIEKPSSHG